MPEIRRTYCGPCHPRCGARLHIASGRAVKVEGDPDAPGLCSPEIGSWPHTVLLCRLEREGTT